MFSIIHEPVHGIIYKNSKKEKRVMRHSEIHKFCDTTLNRVLEGLRSYNKDVKYGYIQRDLTNEEVEYLKLFEEEIETDEAAPTPIPSPRWHTARMSVRPQTPISLSSEAKVERLLALPIPPPSLLSHWSSPLPQIPSPPLPPLPSSLHLPLHVPTSLPLPSSPLPPLSASLFIPPLVDRREDILEAKLPPCKRLCLTAPTSRYKVGESSTVVPRPTRGHRADYGFIHTMDAEIRR
ncbi:hypothetical protein Tco_1471099 [Tanacetum coccineum]